MRNLILFIFIITAVNLTYAQSNRLEIAGIVSLDSIPVKDVHIINLNTKTGTISNDLGEFIIPVKLGDSLSFSHINLKKKVITITKEALEVLRININLTQQIVSLKEFTLEKPRSIFEQDKDIFVYKGPVINATTLNLPYANTVAKKDGAIFKLSSGGVVNLDNLINALNGNNRSTKLLKKVQLEDTRLSNIRKYFSDDFFITDLQIKKEQINPFLNYCIQQNIIYHFNKKENLKVMAILLKQSKSFPLKEASDIKVTLKKD